MWFNNLNWYLKMVFTCLKWKPRGWGIFLIYMDFVIALDLYSWLDACLFPLLLCCTSSLNWCHITKPNLCGCTQEVQEGRGARLEQRWSTAAGAVQARKGYQWAKICRNHVLLQLSYWGRIGLLLELLFPEWNSLVHKGRVTDCHRYSISEYTLFRLKIFWYMHTLAFLSG